MKITHCFRRVREIAGGAALAMLAGIMFAIVGSLAAAPAARAQIVPVSLTHEALSDSKIPNRVALLPPSRSEPTKPVADAQTAVLCHERGGYAAAGRDMEESASRRPHFHEVDPLAKPFVALPIPA